MAAGRGRGSGRRERKPRDFSKVSRTGEQDLVVEIVGGVVERSTPFLPRLSIADENEVARHGLKERVRRGAISDRSDGGSERFLTTASRRERGTAVSPGKAVVTPPNYTLGYRRRERPRD